MDRAGGCGTCPGGCVTGAGRGARGTGSDGKGGGAIGLVLIISSSRSEAPLCLDGVRRGGTGVLMSGRDATTS